MNESFRAGSRREHGLTQEGIIMRTIRLLTPSRNVLPPATLLALLVAVSMPVARAATLIDCPGNGGLGDRNSRGFYVPDFRGETLDTVTLHIAGSLPGVITTLDLTARESTYDGALVGTATRLAILPTSSNAAITFTFGSPDIVPGTRVCFILTASTSTDPDATVYYEVPDFSGGCPEVIQTTGTNPPLSSHRRDGVRVTITGKATLVVNPGESIQAAIDRCDPGDRVFVRPGTYNEDISLKSDVDVIGSGHAFTTIEGTGGGDVVWAFKVSNARLEGFTIRNSGPGSSDAGVKIYGGDLLLNNNRILDNNDGVYVYGNSSAIIRNNIVTANGENGNGWLNYGIIVLHATPLIANNIVHLNIGVGMYIAWADSAGTQIINNTIVENEDSGIWCYQVSDVVIKNNISVANMTGFSASHSSVPLLTFNNSWGNTGLDYDSQSGGSAAPGVGSISDDPAFATTGEALYALDEGSPCIDAGDPHPVYEDPDGTRNDMGAYGGPSGLQAGGFGPIATGFLFNNIGKIPTSEITQTGPTAGLVNVSAAVANDLSIYPYVDAPLGGRLWLHGLFGTMDSQVRYYQVLMAPWVGGSPPAPGDFVPITDPLTKIKYTINLSGTVDTTRESIGPDENGRYLRTDDGYWAHPDLKMIWNTRRVPDGKYDLWGVGYDSAGMLVNLFSNELTRITVHLDNQQVTAVIHEVLDAYGAGIQECGIITVGSDTQDVQFVITAAHPNGFLRNYTLKSYFGKNQLAGTITADQYVGSNDGSPPTWNGVDPLTVHTLPAHTAGTLDPWTTCAYQFQLGVWARTTDGFHHIYRRWFSDHYYVMMGAVAGCRADFNGDGRVDGIDLAAFAEEYGRTDCGTP